MMIVMEPGLRATPKAMHMRLYLQACRGNAKNAKTMIAIRCWWLEKNIDGSESGKGDETYSGEATLPRRRHLNMGNIHDVNKLILKRGLGQ